MPRFPRDAAARTAAAAAAVDGYHFAAVVKIA